MFTEIIDKLLEMRAEEEAKLQKIDKLLAECGYIVAPIAVTTPCIAREFINDVQENIAENIEENIEKPIDNEISIDYNQGEERND